MFSPQKADRGAYGAENGSRSPRRPDGTRGFNWIGGLAGCGRGKLLTASGSRKIVPNGQQSSGIGGVAASKGNEALLSNSGESNSNGPHGGQSLQLDRTDTPSSCPSHTVLQKEQREKIEALERENGELRSEMSTMNRYLSYIQTQIKARDQHIMALIERRKMDIRRMNYALAHLQHMGAHDIVRLISSDMEMETREDEEKHLLSSPPPPSPYPSKNMQTPSEVQSTSLAKSLGVSVSQVAGSSSNEGILHVGHGAMQSISMGHPNDIRGEDLGRHLLRQLHLGSSKQAASENSVVRKPSASLPQEEEDEIIYNSRRM